VLLKCLFHNRENHSLNALLSKLQLVTKRVYFKSLLTASVENVHHENMMCAPVGVTSIPESGTAIRESTWKTFLLISLSHEKGRRIFPYSSLRADIRALRIGECGSQIPATQNNGNCNFCRSVIWMGLKLRQTPELSWAEMRGRERYWTERSWNIARPSLVVAYPKIGLTSWDY
jgi:hypothetical protein